jgi:hypothetical protein
MRGGPLIATVILLGIAAISVAQEKPNFSSEWVLNRQASTLSLGADAIESGVWQIEHREPTFHHKAALVTAGKPFNYEYELQSDGREVVGRGETKTTCGFSSAIELGTAAYQHQPPIMPPTSCARRNEEVVSLSLTCYGSLFAACPSAVSRSWRRTLPFSSQ